MNEQHFAYKIRQNLNLGLHELSPDTLERLAAAREKALTCQKQTVRSSVLATAGGFFHDFQDHVGHLKLGQTLSAIALLLTIVFTVYWMEDESISEQGTIDSELLADDLPIGAFTDKGFAAWLDHSSQD